MVKPSYVSTLPPSIPVKSPKEVNEISKYFKKNPSSTQKKSYAQALYNGSNTAREILKIKEAFPSLQNKKSNLSRKSLVVKTN